MAHGREYIWRKARAMGEKKKMCITISRMILVRLVLVLYADID